MVTVKELLERHDFFDFAIMRHGFTDYMRDYQMIVGFGHVTGNAVYKYQFIGCVEASFISAIQPKFLKESLTDLHVLAGPGNPEIEEPPGFIWGVRFAEAYPGWTYVEDGERGKYWSGMLGRKMHELFIETNAFNLRLVFGDLRVALMGSEPELKIEEDYPLPITDKTSDGGIE